MNSTWLAYNELAWTEDWLGDPEEYEEEVALYRKLLHQYSIKPPRTLLHLGSGAGGHDRIFKRYFDVTGVDISPGMLEMARLANPDIEYLEEDMRTVSLNRKFDAVVIPDSIDYMVSLDDLEQVVQNAVGHLKENAVLLLVGKTRETFQNNNFAYCREKHQVHVTLLENNHINPYPAHTYEAIFVYLIRRHGELTMHTDHHQLGLFPEAEWDRIFRKSEILTHKIPLDGLYDKYLLNDGAYPLTVFVGQKLG